MIEGLGTINGKVAEKRKMKVEINIHVIKTDIPHSQVEIEIGHHEGHGGGQEEGHPGGHLVVESVRQNLDNVESTKVEILQPEPGIEHRIEGILRTEAATIPHQEVTERENPLTVAGKVLLREGEKDLIGEVIVFQEAAVKHRTATETGVERGKTSERNFCQRVHQARLKVKNYPEVIYVINYGGGNRMTMKEMNIPEGDRLVVQGINVAHLEKVTLKTSMIPGTVEGIINLRRDPLVRDQNKVKTLRTNAQGTLVTQK